MFIRTTAVAIALGGIAFGSTAAQSSLTPQQSVTAATEQTPVFRVTVVGRTTPAINYRPRAGQTRVDFAGTPLMPAAKGRATVEGGKGYIEVDSTFDALGAPSRFGPEYLTYVLWAITPEGRPTNLGELQVRGNDGKLHVTTELQAFGMIVTAEPYFAVTQPSDVVVMENVVRNDTEGNVQPIMAKYELLKRGTYLMNGDATKLKVKPLEPGAPLDLAEARNAVALARMAGADQYAFDTYQKAAALLASAEQAREKRRSGNQVMMPARQAVQTAEDARLIALQKMEETAATNERIALQAREKLALERARVEENRRLTLEREKVDAEAARAAAERDRAAAERDRLAASEALAAAARDKQQAEAARLSAEQAAQQAQAAAAQSDREKAELREKLREQLNVILETRETARGLIVNLSDVLFDTARHDLKPGAREKVAKIAGILLAYPGLQIEIDGHTDSVGADDYNQRLSERRAAAVRAYLVTQGIPPSTVTAMGFGEQQPVVSNTTAAGRQQNRRVELVVSGEPIAVAGR
jgi:outer membrane protein OmpA-like peptidoglycan-associated protein